MNTEYKKLLTPHQVAKRLGCSEGTLANWRSLEKGLRFTKMPNGRVYYPEEAIELYLIEISKAQNYTNSMMMDINTVLATHKLTQPISSTFQQKN